MLGWLKTKVKYYRNFDELKVRNHIILLTYLFGFLALVYSYTEDLIFLPNFGDPASRLDASRRFYDSLTPGIWNQIGTVWLPAHMILLIPFTWISVLWETGLAGCIVGYGSYVAASILIYKSVYILTKDKTSAVIGWAVYALNPNILYLQTTAMSEPVFFMFVILALYFLLKLNEFENDIDMVKSSFFMMAAVATRYEGWFMFAVSSVFVFIWYFKKMDFPIKHTILYIFSSSAFIAYWLWHNWSRYGDPLEFQRGKYSLLHHANAFLKSNLLPTKDNLLLSLDYYWKSMNLNMGYFMILLFSAGLILYFFKNKLNPKSFFPYFLLIIFPFSVYSLYKGQSVMLLPNTEHPGFVHSRYGLAMLPAVALFAGVFYSIAKDSKFIRGFQNRRILLAGFIVLCFVGQVSYWSAFFPKNVPSLAELEYGSVEAYYRIKNVSEFLAERYDGGNILMDEVIVRLLPSCGIPYKERVFPYTWELGEKSLNTPSQYVNWIIVDKNAVKGNDIALHFDEVYDKIKDNKNFQYHYKVVYAKDGIEVFKRTHK